MPNRVRLGIFLAFQLPLLCLGDVASVGAGIGMILHGNRTVGSAQGAGLAAGDFPFATLTDFRTSFLSA